jgi:hypothetical protein
MSIEPINEQGQNLSREILGQQLGSIRARESALLSFAGSVINAHGVKQGSYIPVTCQNFLPDSSARQPISNPEGDSYLTFLGIGAADYNGVVVTLKTLGGVLDYYRSIGLITNNTRVIEVNPILSQNSYKGYPNSSPLECLVKDNIALGQLQKLNKHDDLIFVGTFLTDHMRDTLNSLGLNFVQQANPFITNNKELFHANCKCNLMPSILINGEDDLLSAIQLLKDSIIKTGITEDGSIIAWLKLSGGSGGDFVQKIVVSNDEAMSPYLDGILTNKVFDAIRNIRNSVEKAFNNNDYGRNALESFWSADKLSPNDSALVLEQDVRTKGEILANCSNLILINTDGSFRTLGNYKQITGIDGDYIGSRPYDPNSEYAEFSDRLHTNMETIVQYAMQNNHYGFAGVDYFAVKTPDGQIEFVMTELNARMPISGTAHIMAQKLQASAWINVNLEADKEIISFSDFEKMYSEHILTANDATLLKNGQLNACKIIPQAFRTLQDNSGQIIPSAKFKALIVGPDIRSCERFLFSLQSKK